MLAKESQVKDFLFKEAEEKKEYRKKIAVHDILFSETEKGQLALEEDESLEKEAMSQQSGGSNLKNSGWNTDWRFGDTDSEIERVKGEVAQKAGHFFAALNGQGPFSTSTSDLRPKSLSFLFHYFRTIIPDKNEESAGKAKNALTVLDQMFPDQQLLFSQFVQDIQNSNIPLNPYFMVSKFSGDDGGIGEPNLHKFIGEEQNKQLALPDRSEVPSASHFKEHAARLAAGQPVNRTNYVDKAQTFSMKEINTATARMLEYAINDRIKDGYILKIDPMGPTDKGPTVKAAVYALRNQRYAENGLDIENPAHQQHALLYTRHYFNMKENIENWNNDPSSIKLSAFELRLVLQNMVHMGGAAPKTPPDQFRASVKTLYSANGWDSTSNDPNQSMLTLPPLRQLPSGDVIYDRGNGNMGYDHLILNWKNGLSQLIQKWGPKCAEWLSLLQGGQGIQQITQQSPEIEAAWQNVISLQSGNRTGAETLLDLFKDYPTWEAFNRNHLQKSLASEIRSVNNLRKNPAAGIIKTLDDLPRQLQAHAQKIVQLGETDPKAAQDRLIQISSDLVRAYSSGGMNWRNLTLALHYLNVPVASTGMRYQNEEGKNQRVTNGLTAHSMKRQQNMLDEQGFGLLQKHGYQVAKMMDFLSAVMYRSCHEQSSTPYGPENKFGHQYSTSSGTSKGGDIVLIVDFEKLEAVPSADKVDVYEKLSFNLGQKSGANEEPILLRSELPWEQMVEVFNEMYPEAGYQFSVVEEPISKDLNKLEQKIKEAINDERLRHAANTKVVYHNSEGHEFPLTAENVAIEEMSNKEDAGETNLIDNTQEGAMQPEVQPEAQPEVQPEAQPQEPWSMEFTPDPTPEELDPGMTGGTETMQPDPTYTFTAPEEPQKREMPKPKPMSEPMTVPINDPAARYIQKRDTKSRRLLRQNSGLGSIEERLQKAANKLDECNEFTVADKIDLLLTKLNEGKDVREASHV